MTEEELAELESQGTDGIRIFLKVTAADEMNVYLYGGSSKRNATIPIVDQNAPVKVGKTYTIDANDGMLLVAYPNHNVTTNFQFTYWVGGYTEGMLDDETNCEEGDILCELGTIGLIIGGVAAFVLLVIIFCICRACCKKRSKS